MQANRHRTIAALTLFALGLAACGFLLGLSNVGTAGQSDSRVTGKGLGNAKPIEIEARPDKDVRVNSGWKLFLVGTNVYENLSAKYDLHYAVKDVESLKSQFIQLGVPEENITLLTSESRGKWLSKQKNIENAFQDFVASLEPSDSAFVYLSGHGFRFNEDKRAYYAPKDIDLDDVRGTGISIDDMLQQLKESEAKFKWMTVDACRNDPGDNTKALSSEITSDFIMDPANLPDAFVFMYGCADEQCSLESPDLEQGLLTYSLLEALQCNDNRAVRGDSFELEFSDLINYVQKRTDELAHLCRDDSDKPFEQIPHITCAQLPSFTLLTNLRHGGLTQSQWQELKSEEKNFEDHLANKEFDRAQECLTTLVGYYPEGTESQQYQELKARLEQARADDDASRQAELYYQRAQNALEKEDYSSAQFYIDKAIDLKNTPEYKRFRDVLATDVEAAVRSAIFRRDVDQAEELHKLLHKLDPQNKSYAELQEEIDELQSINLDPARRRPGAVATLNIAGEDVRFHWAPAGKFFMGSTSREEEVFYNQVQHDVTLTQGFWIAETETTQELWEAITGKNPSSFKGSKQLPVESVSWKDVQDFIKTLNNEYESDLPDGFEFALPTEAQWEYACRAGTETPFNFGKSLNGDKANCDGRYPYGTSEKGSRLGKTKEVKSYPPNAWGVYDMHGNVSEFCSDWYSYDYYTLSSANKDPKGPKSGSFRVIRGGDYHKFAKFSRSAARSCDVEDKGYSNYGFRLVLTQTSSRAQSSDGNKAGATKTLTLKGVKVNFHWAPAGSFKMGCPETETAPFDDEERHEVELTQGFWIAETETTQALWQAVMGTNPSHFTETKSGDEQLPVESISWQDCKEFVDKLNSKYSSALPDGYKYAMPTEAQWEYACRAGTTTPFSFGSTLNGDKANCDGRYPYGTSAKGAYKGKTTPVKSYAPNAWGLYDMHGNVWEWCADWYGQDFYSKPEAKQDPAGPESGSDRVLRGGSWSSNAGSCRSAGRNGSSPGNRILSSGFRLSLVR